eukprot:3458986-Pyramimonas_sp.AAC.1
MGGEGMPPIVRHEQWPRTAGVAAGGRSLYEHEVLCRVIDSMSTADQLNAPALQAMEMIARGLQLIDEARGISPGSPDYSAADHYMGWNSRRHGATVAPAPSEHAATRMKNETT